MMMDIDTMDAGREMDALVAEKVMGWKVSYTYEGYPRYEDHGPVGSYWASIPEFSTRIEKAWEVVEKMDSLGWKFGMVQDGNGWDVNIYHPDVHPSCQSCGHTSSGAINAFADTAPLAISRAALKATNNE
jgi:hypothetical protein